MTAGHVDVCIIGAGLSGIGAAWRLREAFPRKTYAVLEARDAIGGTWDLFRYPGVRSDSDMYTLAYPFRPWRGRSALAGGDAIREYLRQTADEAGITPHVRFGARVVRAQWSSARAHWTVHLADGTSLTCSFLYACTGYYDYAAGHQPRFPGEFRHPLVHPQFWPADLDHRGRRVVVIGSGATAATLVPAMAPEAAHVTMLQRSPTYMLPLPGRNLIGAVTRPLPARAGNVVARTVYVMLGQGLYRLSRSRPAWVRGALRRRAVHLIGDEDYVDTHFRPSYDPWDQRLCVLPGGDLYREIRAGRASVVTGHVDRLAPEGIRLTDGRLIEADVIVAATGLRLQPLGGVRLEVDGAPVDLGARAAYRGVLLSGVPNLAFCLGYANASWTLRADLSHRYVCRLLRHMDRHGHTVATPGAPERDGGPLLDLASGYVRRAVALFPRQGDRDPWRFRQNYLRDVLAMPRADVTEEMRFEGGTPMIRAYRFAGRTAVLTGAAGGIGEQLAHRLAGRGSHLVLIDVDAPRLSAVAGRIRAAHPGLTVETIAADLGDRAAVEDVAARVLAAHPRIGLLINNAGIALGGRFDQISVADFETVMNVNFRAPMLLTHALLPALKASPGSHLVNVSSLFGLIAPPGQSAYAASKFALRGLSQALHAELSGVGVGVTTVHPGGVRTRIAERALVGSGVPAAEIEPNRRLFRALLTYPPEKAADRILDAVAHRRARLLIAANAKLPDLLARLAPAGHMRAVRALTSASAALAAHAAARDATRAASRAAGKAAS